MNHKLEKDFMKNPYGNPLRERKMYNVRSLYDQRIIKGKVH